MSRTKFDGFVKSPHMALRFILRHCGGQMNKRCRVQGEKVGIEHTLNLCHASFLSLPVEGRHSRALHLELFTVPLRLTTFCHRQPGNQADSSPKA
jgi:hypothetical protein